jgi:hypothetical protein
MNLLDFDETANKYLEIINDILAKNLDAFNSRSISHEIVSIGSPNTLNKTKLNIKYSSLDEDKNIFKVKQNASKKVEITSTLSATKINFTNLNDNIKIENNDIVYYEDSTNSDKYYNLSSIHYADLASKVGTLTLTQHNYINYLIIYKTINYIYNQNYSAKSFHSITIDSDYIKTNVFNNNITSIPSYNYSTHTRLKNIIDILQALNNYNHEDYENVVECLWYYYKLVIIEYTRKYLKDQFALFANDHIKAVFTTIPDTNKLLPNNNSRTLASDDYTITAKTENNTIDDILTNIITALLNIDITRANLTNILTGTPTRGTDNIQLMTHLFGVFGPESPDGKSINILYYNDTQYPNSSNYPEDYYTALYANINGITNYKKNLFERILGNVTHAASFLSYNNLYMLLEIYYELGFKDYRTGSSSIDYNSIETDITITSGNFDNFSLDSYISYGTRADAHGNTIIPVLPSIDKTFIKIIGPKEDSANTLNYLRLYGIIYKTLIHLSIVTRTTDGADGESNKTIVKNYCDCITEILNLTDEVEGNLRTYNSKISDQANIIYCAIVAASRSFSSSDTFDTILSVFEENVAKHALGITKLTKNTDGSDCYKNLIIGYDESSTFHCFVKKETKLPIILITKSNLAKDTSEVLASEGSLDITTIKCYGSLNYFADLYATQKTHYTTVLPKYLQKIEDLKAAIDKLEPNTNKITINTYITKFDVAIDANNAITNMIYNLDADDNPGLYEKCEDLIKAIKESQKVFTVYSNYEDKITTFHNNIQSGENLINRDSIGISKDKISKSNNAFKSNIDNYNKTQKDLDKFLKKNIYNNIFLYITIVILILICLGLIYINNNKAEYKTQYSIILLAFLLLYYIIYSSFVINITEKFTIDEIELNDTHEKIYAYLKSIINSNKEYATSLEKEQIKYNNYEKSSKAKLNNLEIYLNDEVINAIKSKELVKFLLLFTSICIVTYIAYVNINDITITTIIFIILFVIIIAIYFYNINLMTRTNVSNKYWNHKMIAK